MERELHKVGRTAGQVQSKRAASPFAPSYRVLEYAYYKRWWSILSVAAQRAVALSLIEVDCEAIKPLADLEPRIGDVLADACYDLGPVVSRMPLRG